MMATALGDVFDEDSDGDIATSEWDRLRQSRIKDGYRAGFEAGQETTLQAGFNEGYCEGVRSAYQINYMKGLLSALKAYCEQTDHHGFSDSEKEVIKEMLQELEALEQSQYTTLQNSTKENAAAAETLNAMSAASQPVGGNERVDVSTISRDLKQLHMQEHAGKETLHSQVTQFPDGRGDDSKGAASAVERLREISQRCRSLFSQLDIQNLLQ